MASLTSLLAILSISNAQHSGVLINFSLDDYKRGMRVDGSMVFAVAEHKTLTTHGAATFAVNDDEEQLLHAYMTKFRYLDQFINAAPYVFVNHTGTQMTQSNVAAALTVAFQKTGYKHGVSCTKLRKAAVTEVHSHHPESKQSCANHMNHRLTTAVIHYGHINKQKNAVSCSKIIRHALSCGSKPSATVTSSSLVDCAGLNSDPGHSAPDPERQSSMSAAAAYSNTCDDVSETEDGANVEQVFAESNYEPYQKKVRWNEEDRDMVRWKFDDFVKRQKTPIVEITAALKRDTHLRLHLESSLGLHDVKLAHAVRDKVRSFFRWTKNSH